MHGHKKWLPALFVLAGLVMSALTCSGTITTFQNRFPTSGHIELRISEADREVNHDILIDKNWPGVKLHVDVTLEMKEGSFSVELVDGTGSRFPLKAASGEPASLSTELVTDLSGEIRIEGDGRNAKDILLTIDYSGSELPRRWQDSDSD